MTVPGGCVKWPRRAAAAGCLALAAACLAACGAGAGTGASPGPGPASGAGPGSGTGPGTGTGPGSGTGAGLGGGAGAGSGGGAGTAGNPPAASGARAGSVSSRSPGSATPGASGPAAGDPPGQSGPAVTPAILRSSADDPSGFWYGTDSWPVPVSGSTPHKIASIGGSYGGYLGMAGNWARWQGCGTGSFLAWSGTNSEQADANYTRYGAGIGTGVYWYMGGPGVDPHWNGTAGEASAWGAAQAAQAIADAGRDHVTYPVLFMDIEMPGIKPAPDNGWQDVYTSPCSGVARPGRYVTPALARAEFNGFAGYLTAHSRYRAGVYSDSAIWEQVFGTGPDSRIPHTYEWTYEPETADLKAAPRGWCLTGGAGGCAQFFGDVSGSSRYAVMWQWSGGGGVSNSIGDFDQIDTATVR
jgi:hypothetical protein